jgi:hypothetical protein
MVTPTEATNATPTTIPNAIELLTIVARSHRDFGYAATPNRTHTPYKIKAACLTVNPASKSLSR